MMTTTRKPTDPIIAVLCGGTSSEREVSLGSGAASAIALSRSFPTRMFIVDADALPAGLDPAQHVVFSTLHGTFGEAAGSTNCASQSKLVLDSIDSD